MKVTCIQKNIKTQLPKIELPKSPIGKIDCEPDIILDRIDEFKENAIPVYGTSDEFILSNKNKVIRSDYVDKKGNQLTWQKIFTPNKKLLEENFIDILNKANIKYDLSNGNIRFLRASTPRGTVIYKFS
jgi:hypothetical protein